MRIGKLILSFCYDSVIFLAVMAYALGSKILNRKEEKLGWSMQRLRPIDRHFHGRPYWIHGVSAGEVKVAKAFIKHLSATDSGRPIVLSSSTQSGFKAASDEDALNSLIMPFDIRHLMKSAIARIDPICIILVESEIWPQLLWAAHRRGIPVIILSAKISDRTYRRLSKIPKLAAWLLSFVTHYFVQDDTTSFRLQELGVSFTKITVSGNFKLTPPDLPTVNKPHLCRKDKENVLVFGNVHPEEAGMVASTAERILAAHPFMAVVIVPRHPSKFDEHGVKSLFARHIEFVSGEKAAPCHGRILWINKMGVLGTIYDAADIAVVGGTFCDVGGHDLVEPLHRGALAVYGPKTHSQRSLCEWLEDKPYSFQVHSGEELFGAVSNLVNSPSRVVKLRQQALTDLAYFRSQSRKTAEALAQLIDTRLVDQTESP